MKSVCRLHLYIPGLIGPTEKYTSFGEWTHKKICGLEEHDEKVNRDISLIQKTAKIENAKKLKSIEDL